MPRAKRKMLAMIASLSTMLTQSSGQTLAGLPQKIFLSTNMVENLSYPDCFCDSGPSCDSCIDSSVLISCEGCDGTYFMDNPADRKIRLDGSWSPEGQEFEIELKIVGKEGSQPQPQKIQVIRVPLDCGFSAFYLKSLTLAPNLSINHNSESQLSEVFLGPFSDLNCGALDFNVQGKCYSISTQSDQSVTLAWHPSQDECRENNSSFLTISLKQHPRVKLDFNIQDLLFSEPGQTSLISRFEMLNTKKRQEVVTTFPEPRNLNHVGTDCATSFSFATHPNPAFTYEDCQGSYTYIPQLIFEPVGCVLQIIYMDWDITGNCYQQQPDVNVSTNVPYIPPVISDLNRCGWIQVPQVGDSNSFTIDSCSETTNSRFTTQFSPTAPTTYGIYHCLRVQSGTTYLSKTENFNFQVLPHCTGLTTMIAPTLPPMSFDFAAGIPQYTIGFIPAFDDTVSAPNTKKCLTRTCTSDSPYAVWSQVDQKFAVGTTGWQQRTDVPGDHIITLTCGLTSYPLVPQVSSSWTLKIAASCYSANIIAPVVSPNYDVYSGTIDVTTIPKFQDTNSLANGIDGTGSDLCGSRYCTTNSLYAVISATQDITIKAIPGNFDTGVFSVTITCALGYGTTPSSQTISFTVTVKPCVYTSIIATTVMSGSAAPLVQTVLGPSLSWPLDTLTSTSLLNCLYTFTYHVQMRDGTTDFTPFGGALSTEVPPVLTIYTTNDAAKGTYDLQWYVTSTTNPAQAIVYVDFQVQIKDCIVLSTTGSSYVAFTRTQNIFTPFYSSALSLRTQVPACGYSQVYSCSVKEAGASVWSTTSWCTTTATNLEIQTNDYLLNLRQFSVKQTVKIGLIYSESASSSSTVDFSDPCTTSIFVNYNVPNQLYFITSEGLPSLPFLFPWLDDNINQSFGTSTTDSICYKSTTLFTDAGIAPRYAMISQKLDGSSDVTISTTETTLAGIHTLKASYTFQRYPLIAAKQILATLKLYQLLTPKAIDKTYQIKELALKFTVDAFSALPPSSTLECVQKVALSDGKPLPGFINLVTTDTQFQFSVQSSDDNNAGTYTIKIAAKFSEDSKTFETSTTFKVIVTASQQAKPMNQPPVFDSKLGGPFDLKIGDNWSYTLPTYSDPEGQNVTLTVDFDTAQMFIANQNKKLFFFTATTAINVGTYTIKLKLTDSQGASKKYSFDLTIQDPVANATQLVNNKAASSQTSNEQLLALLEDTPDWNWLDQFISAQAKGRNSPLPPIPPKVKFSQISILGEVELKFSKPMTTPPLSLFRTVSEPKQSIHRSLLGNNYKTQAITILSTQGDPEDHTDLSFGYNVTSYQGQTMKIQLDFSTASHVSQNRFQDIISIIFNGNYIFFDTEGIFIDKDTIITCQLPSQLQFNTTETKLVVQATEVSQQSSTVVMSSNLFLNLLLSAALNQLFSMVRIQQIVTLMPLFNVRLPGNAALFFGFALQIASFDLIPMSDLYDYMFASITTNNVLSPNFAQLGISSTLFLYNFGSLILAFVAIPIVLLAYPLLIPCKRFDRIENLRRKVWTATFFNNTIKTIMESYLILVICVSINTLDVRQHFQLLIAEME